MFIMERVFTLHLLFYLLYNAPVPNRKVGETTPWNPKPEGLLKMCPLQEMERVIAPKSSIIVTV